MVIKNYPFGCGKEAEALQACIQAILVVNSANAKQLRKEKIIKIESHHSLDLSVIYLKNVLINSHFIVHLLVFPHGREKYIITAANT